MTTTKKTRPSPNDPMYRWSETEFQTFLLQRAAGHGWSLRYHTYDSRRSAPGFPDLVLVHPVRGRTIFRELKTETGRVSPDQRGWIDGLTAGGSDAAVWRPSDYLSGLIEQELRS
ncbi:VRR-NUC domain-containing protein [Kocuria sp. KH4]